MPIESRLFALAPGLPRRHIVKRHSLRTACSAASSGRLRRALVKTIGMARAAGIAVLLSAHPVCHAQDGDGQIIERIAAAQASIQSLQCDFVQEKSVKMLGDKMTSKGRMCCTLPDRLRWEYTTPYSYTFILNDMKVTLLRGERADVVDAGRNKMFREIANIMMGSLVGKWLTDGRSFKTTVSNAPSEWLVTLTPQSKQLRTMFSRIVLHFNRQQAVIVGIDMHETNGDTTRISLVNIIKNKRIDERLYSAP